METASESPPAAELAARIWRAGVAAVEGGAATRNALRREKGFSPDTVLAVGKAASAMLLGALEFLSPSTRALLITKEGHVDPRLRQDERIRIIEAGHPVPDENSLVAGRAALDFVSGCPADSRLLVLVSGGASALAELPRPGMDLASLRQLSDTLLADGFSIDQINHIRIGISRIKGGGLLRRFRGREILVLAISDIPGDDAGLIGSGIAALEPPRVEPFEIPPWIRQLMRHGAAEGVSAQPPFRYRSLLVGSNAVARRSAEDAARSAGLAVIESCEPLEGDVDALANTLARRIITGEDGVYIWGGEPTVRLPPDPGRGGRNQSLALALTLALGKQRRIAGIIAGTDGTDGPTTAAGGILGPLVDRDAAMDSLARADAGSWLESHDRLFTTGPTGTNVMDLAVLVKITA